MAEGVLAANAPPDFGFSPSPHINIYNGLWFSKYPFGTSLFLVPGILAGMPWLMPAIATALTLLLFFAIVRRLFDTRVAYVALLFALISPTTLLIGGSLLSQPVSKLCVAVYLYCVVRLANGAGRVQSVLFAALAGLAIGYGFNTRPLVAVIFGVVGTVFLIFKLVQKSDEGAFVLPVLAMVTTGLIMVGLFFAWNAYLTGDPSLFTYHALQRADRMGFGVRGEGYAPFVHDFRIDFTPAYAFGRIFWHTLPAVFLNTLGWGWYEPSMFFPSEPRHLFPWSAPVLLIPIFLTIFPLFSRSRTLPDIYCASIFLLTLFVLLFQYSDHSSWGATPLNTSYYNEATLFGLIPLMARGGLLFTDIAKRWVGIFAVPLVAIVAIVLFANSVATNREFARQLRNWNPYYQKLPRLVANGNIHDAVVFLPHSRDAPVGEFPFKPLQAADVVFFRLGPLPQWGLSETDWRRPYKTFFADRSAYIFDGTTLEKLDVTDAR
jgi:4-amino-4-deoxy-L-arabinose transferase-like glycosyltransferase